VGFYFFTASISAWRENLAGGATKDGSIHIVDASAMNAALAKTPAQTGGGFAPGALASCRVGRITLDPVAFRKRRRGVEGRG